MASMNQTVRFAPAALVAAMALMVAACSGGGGDVDDSKVYELRMSTQLADTSPMVDGFKKWAEAVDERTDGHVQIEVFTSAQLGSDEDVIEQALQGTNVAVLTDGGRMSNYVHDIGIIGMPYLVDSYEELTSVTETDTFAGFDDDFEGQGIRILAYNWYDGPRNFYTNKEISSPADLNGQRVRTPGAPVWSKSVEALGATPVDMPWPDSYNALQSKAIDGVEVQSTSAYPASIWEVVTTMARTEHFHLANFIMVGEKWISTLPEEYQTILADEAKSAAAENALHVQEVAVDFEEKMVENGLTINDVDKTPFIEAAQKAYEELGFADLRDQIWSEIGKN